ncbi:MAG: redoxin domain-containing protein [Fimbriimonadales bacterium]
MLRRWLVASILLSLLLGDSAVAQTLKEGDQAPPIKVARWIKGKPVEKFEPGKVYVVEFWATWCGPCRQTIPHLTEVAKKFKDKVTIIGVSVWERVGVEQVEQFVRTMGDKMDYGVAFDDGETMANTWMRAANQNGIPTAFVVDQQGRIVWIGHPMAELEEVLEAVVAGKYDWQTAAKQRQEQAKREAELESAFEKIGDLIGEKKYDEALAELDKLMDKMPEMREPLSGVRLRILLIADEKRAYAYASELAQGTYKDDPQMLNMLAWTIVGDDQPIQLKQPDYDLALTIAQRAVELTKEQDAGILDTLAMAHFRKGQLEKAIEVQRKAIAVAEKDPETPKELLSELQKRLQEFEKALREKANP